MLCVVGFAEIKQQNIFLFIFNNHFIQIYLTKRHCLMIENLFVAWDWGKRRDKAAGTIFLLLLQSPHHYHSGYIVLGSLKF